MRAIENPAYRLPDMGSTFHGRDVFAPAAAYLSLGKSSGSFGKRKETFVELAFPVPFRLRGTVTGEIVHVDRFGNAITNLTPRDLDAGAPPAIAMAAAPSKKTPRNAVTLKAKGKAFPLAAFYSQAAPGKPLSVAGSSGFLELSINGGNAARKFGLKRGDAIKVA